MNIKIEDPGDYEQQSEMPFKDNLTELFHHGFFLSVLNREIKLSQRYGEKISLVIIDIDAFSIYNKQHGPLQADRALKEIAAIIGKCVRDVDLTARLGGDTFAVLLTKAGASPGAGAVERIRDAINEHYHGALTVGIGSATCPDDADNMDDLMSRAKDALKHSKLKGKNEICVCERYKGAPGADEPRVLVVDDVPMNVKILEAMLFPLKYKVSRAYSGREALALIERGDIDLVLLDIMMPGINGIEVCRRIKSREQTRIIPVVMVTSLDESEAKIQAIDAGADDFISKPINKLELMARTRSLIAVKRLNEHMIGFENVLISLANAVEAKDVYTRGHIKRVSSMALQMGKNMNLSPRELEALRIGGILHDIGKIGIPDAILKKEGGLDPDEWEVMKTHPTVGYQLVYPLKQTLHQALDIIRSHHEKMDGSGYPDGLQGEAISMVARIMAVADSYDALITDRPYRKALSREEVLRLVRQEAEKGKLDGQVVDTLIALLNKESQKTPLEAAGAIQARDCALLTTDIPMAKNDKPPDLIANPPLPSLDWEEGLKRLGGNRELYLRLLGDFIAGYGNAPAQLQQELLADKRDEAGHRLHAIRGVAGNLGGKELEAAAAELGKACRATAGTGAPFAPEESLRLFADRHGALITAIKDILARQPLLSPAMREGPPGDAAELHPLLEQLQKALASKDPRPCKKILGSVLQKRWPEDQEALLAELNRLVQRYRLTEALAYLNEKFNNAMGKREVCQSS
jgi:putative two-component system response regulator